MSKDFIYSKIVKKEFNWDIEIKPEWQFKFRVLEKQKGVLREICETTGIHAIHAVGGCSHLKITHDCKIILYVNYRMSIYKLLNNMDKHIYKISFRQRYDQDMILDSPIKDYLIHRLDSMLDSRRRFKERLELGEK